MHVLNNVTRPAFFPSGPVAPAPAPIADVEMGPALAAAQPLTQQGLQLVAPGSGPLVGAGKTKTKPSLCLAATLGGLGLVSIAVGLAVGLGPDNNSRRWIGGWVGAWCGVGTALLLGSAAAAYGATRQANGTC